MILCLVRLSALACALSLSFVMVTGSARAVPRAADLGPQVPMAQPKDGYVGRLALAPTHGPVGTAVTVTGEGFPAEQQLDLVWRTVNGRWKVTVAEYFGREFTPIAYRIATVKSAPFAVAKSQLETIISILVERGPILQARPIRAPAIGVLYSDPVNGDRARQLFDSGLQVAEQLRGGRVV